MDQQTRFYSLEERKKWIEMYFKGKSSREISKYYADNFPEMRTPKQSTILRAVSKFKKHGTLENIKQTGRPRTSTNEDNSVDVIAKIMVFLEYYQVIPHLKI
jgi:transposase